MSSLAPVDAFPTDGDGIVIYSEDNLRELYVAFAQALLPKIDEWAMEATTAGGAASSRYYFLGPGTSTWPEASGGHRNILRAHYSDIMAIAEYKVCAEAHVSAQKVLKPDAILLAGHEPEEIANNAYLGSFPLGLLLEPIIDLKDRYRTDLPGREKFISREEIEFSYETYRNLWIDPRTHWEISCLLLNLDTDIEEPIAVTEDMAILPFPASEKNALWQRITMGSSAMVGGIGTVQSIDTEDIRGAKLRLRATAHTEHGDKELPNTDALVSKMWHLVTALRLLKTGKVFASRFVVVPLSGEGGARSSFALDELDLSRKLWSAVYASRYQLNLSDIANLTAMYSAMTFEADQDHNHLQVGTSRFNTSYGRHSSEDKIIDMAVALESLLLWDVREELKYRLALRGASLLAMANRSDLLEERTPRQTQALLRRIYDVRSAIVHNGEMLKEKDQDVPQLCENLLRDVQRAYLYQIYRGKSIAAIRSDIDNRIVDNLLLVPPIDGNRL